MRLFAYYFLHTTVNQLVRFVRTWAFILVVVLAMLGGLGGFAASWYYREVLAANPTIIEDARALLAASGLTATDACELGYGAFVLAILTIQVVGADRSVSRLFMPADVNLLFASPRSPQEVLAFRVANTVGPALAGALGMLLALPVTSRALGLSGAVGLILSWSMLLAFSILLKVLVFEVGSLHPWFRRNFRWFVFAGLGLLGCVLYLSHRTTDDLLLSAHLILDGPSSRYVPLWGWTKGMPFFGLEGNVSAMVRVGAAGAVSVAVLVWVVAHVPCDYYEQALGRAQEIQRLMDAAGSESVASLMARVWGSGRVGAVGLRHGWGPTVWFFRALHERARTSRHHVTRTMVTYTLVLVGTGLYIRLFLDGADDFLLPLVLSALVFFHTIFSPVTDDIRKAGFLLEPDPIWAKLASSLLGGTACCALDCLVPLVAGSLAAGTSPLTALGYLPCVLTCDLFASAAGAFVEVSLPAALGLSMRQLIEVVLIYVGLILDGSVLAQGIGQGGLVVSFAWVSLLNVGFAATFTGLTSVWLKPSGGRPPRVRTLEAGKDRVARSSYGRAGVALTAMFLAIHVLRVPLAHNFPAHATLVLHAPIYLAGLAVFLVGLGKDTGRVPRAARGLGPRQMARLACVCVFVMYAGNALGLMLQLALTWLHLPSFGVTDLLAGLTGGIGWLDTLLVVVCAPIMEELVFRRCLIDRLAPLRRDLRHRRLGPALRALPQLGRAARLRLPARPRLRLRLPQVRAHPIRPGAAHRDQRPRRHRGAGPGRTGARRGLGRGRLDVHAGARGACGSFAPHIRLGACGPVLHRPRPLLPGRAGARGGIGRHHARPCPLCAGHRRLLRPDAFLGRVRVTDAAGTERVRKS